MFTSKKIGQLLLEKSYVDDASLESAISEQVRRNCKIGEVLVDDGAITQAQLNETLSRQAGIPTAKLENISIGADVISQVPADMVSKYNILPLSRDNGELTLAMADPFERKAIEDLRVVTGCSIKRCYGTPVEMERAILKFYGSNVARMLDDLTPESRIDTDDIETDRELSAAKLHELAREPSLVNLVNLIILDSYN